ncbi:MAG: bifunctional hydroxymethylpyrimidine kinase/phosphomethylpyrimidine kinase [Bryobacteraceae bacterium]|nr:bifunctional hydroxymethylpyrimidine kinase/phosphomethylpyrimidine kinase [Bryobacteraceae bacterium]
MMPVALTIAGSDPSGGAGIQADLKTFHQFGVYGEAAITLLTVQNTRGVTAIEMLAPDFVAAQIRAAASDIPPQAVKTGALGSRAIVEAVAYEVASLPCPVVVDPVMISKHGAPLMSADARQALVTLLLPRATLLTPNLHEAEAITGRPVTNLAEMQEAALALLTLGARAVLIKGGHLEGAAIDLLHDGQQVRTYPAPRCETVHTHGTGCTYSAAITALLARGLSLADALPRAKHYITEAIRTNPGLGQGQGPVNHFAV